MSVDDWRALIEAYLDGRISAEAFARRFMDAWRDARDRRTSVPRTVDDLHAAVEAFESESFEREGETSDDELRDACRRALTHLREETVSVAPGFANGGGGGGARERMQAFSLSASGCLGAGCVIGLIWLALCLLQWAAVSAQVQDVLEWTALPATIVGLVIAFIPILGNLVAFFGAVDIWGWPIWIAAIVFFAAPAATMISGWSRYRRYRR